ncbi:MAG: EF-P lysine aminoacylase EpmA [Alphaproteobacteria bacterium]|nr:EF-P lysine aminoacylase EpmA [Alphaproteobacteria bacterium]
MIPQWHPDVMTKKLPYLKARADLCAAIRGFFNDRGYLEVDTPALQTAPCMEAHLKAFQTTLIAPDGSESVKYLHTSPEFAMKKLLVGGLPKIFQLAKVFRNNEGSRWHSPEFSMLEWYQAGMDYEGMMDETIALLRHVAKDVLRVGDRTCDAHQDWEKITVVEALKKYAGVDIAKNLGDLAHIRAAGRETGVHISDHDDWDNALLKILMDKVEPHLGMGAPTIIYDYPVSMAALSRAKPADPRFAERFEVYVCGIELANAFGELTDAKIQRERFAAEVELRKKIYGEDYPVDEDFLAAVDFGLPDASGNALGFDRLLMLLTGAASIENVQALPV